MIRCELCRKPVDPTAPTTLQRITGWERRALASSRRGGSDIVMREHVEEFAHNNCVEKQRMGISVGQEVLL
jgi:hypothetical protein